MLCLRCLISLWLPLAECVTFACSPEASSLLARRPTRTPVSREALGKAGPARETLGARSKLVWSTIYCSLAFLPPEIYLTASKPAGVVAACHSVREIYIAKSRNESWPAQPGASGQPGELGSALTGLMLANNGNLLCAIYSLVSLCPICIKQSVFMRPA